MRLFLRNTAAVLRREFSRIFSQRIYAVLLFVLPPVAFAFFAVLFQDGVARNIPIAVLDYDRTTLSRKVIDMINDTPTAMVLFEVQDAAEGELLMRQGKVSAVIAIPDNFEKNILSNRQTSVDAFISGSNISVNGLLAKDIQTAVTTFTAGIQIQLLTKQGLTELQAMAQLMPVRFEKHVLFNPYTNYGYYLSPSFMPMMLLIFTLMATVFAIGSELRYSTASEWLKTAHGSLSATIAGKLLPITAVMFVWSLVMLAVIFKLIGTPMNGSASLLILCTLLFITAYQAIGVFFTVVLANMRLALSLGGGYAVLAFTFSGLTFPIMAMSPFMQALSRLFPFTYYTDIIIDIALRGAPAHYALADASSLALFALLIPLSLPRLRKICSDSKFWGKL